IFFARCASIARSRFDSMNWTRGSFARAHLQWLPGVLAFIGAGLLSAAAGQDARSPGGTLVVAISQDPGHLNPAITTSGATHTAAELLYNGLLGRDEHGNPLPELAESWQIEQGGAVYRFRLRDGVKWHDGAPFTSADVKFTLEEVLLKLHAR